MEVSVNKMMKFVCFLCVAWAVFTLVEPSVRPTQGTLMCNRKLVFNQSLILRPALLQFLRYCKMEIKGNISTDRLLINFQEFDMSDTCSDTSLYIYDSSKTNITGTLCGRKLKQTVFKSNTPITAIVYQSTKPDRPVMKNFAVLYTTFNIGTGGKCDADRFRCANGLCIFKDLVCNGYDECSDNSDEVNCGSGDDKTQLYVIVGVIAVVVVIVAAVVTGLVVRSRKRRVPYQDLH